MSNLSAQDLMEQLRQSLSGERTALADFLVALAELDRRRLYVELGWSSAWDFCCRALGLSETATHYRLAAARQIQQQPELVDQIRSGRLCITTLAKLSRIMTDENRADWWARRQENRPVRSSRWWRGSLRNRCRRMWSSARIRRPRARRAAHGGEPHVGLSRP